MALPTIAVQRGAGDDRIGDLVEGTAAARAYDTIGVAVAYASVAGVRTLLDAIKDTQLLNTSYWLFGLDDLLTQPQAIDLVTRLPSSQVRVAGIRVNGKRFHPKVYWFSSQRARTHSSLIVGSANLTRAGFSSNVEAAVVTSASGSEETMALNALWKKAWAAGRRPNARLLEDYNNEYKTARATRAVATRGANKLVLADDEASIDPSLASVCWIEVGNITGFRQEQLEIKAEQALFFGLASSGGPDIEIPVRLQSGRTVEIPVRYRGNFMWRFEFPVSIPEVARGLRPDGGRSPYAAIFTRGASGRISLRFVEVASQEFSDLREATRLAGTLGKTTAREYGWY